MKWINYDLLAQKPSRYSDPEDLQYYRAAVQGRHDIVYNTGGDCPYTHPDMQSIYDAATLREVEDLFDAVKATEIGHGKASTKTRFRRFDDGD